MDCKQSLLCKSICEARGQSLLHPLGLAMICIPSCYAGILVFGKNVRIIDDGKYSYICIFDWHTAGILIKISVKLQFQSLQHELNNY